VAVGRQIRLAADEMLLSK